MFGRKGKEKPVEKERAPRRRGDNLSQFGLMDVPGVDDLGNLDDMLDDGDADLEAELAALVSGGRPRPKPAKRPAAVPDLDSMVADCLKDYDSNDDLSDTEHPELLEELYGLDEPEPPEPQHQPLQQPLVYAGDSLLSIIQTRIPVYREAEEIAQYNGESSKVRRFNRGLKTLQDLEKALKAGRPVREDDIPPQISVGRRKDAGGSSSGGSSDLTPSTQPTTPSHVPDTTEEAPPPPQRREAPPPPPSVRTAPPVPSRNPPENIAPPQPTVPLPTAAPPLFIAPPAKSAPPPTSAPPPKSVIEGRRAELKQLALAAKSSGDKAAALEYMKRIKYCDQLIQDGGMADLSSLPGLDLMTTTTAVTAAATTTAQQVSSGTVPAQRTFSRDDPVLVPAQGEEIPPPNPDIFGAPPPPTSIKDALSQRLVKYKGEETKAKEEGNSSKARRMGRIVKQYEDALKLHKAGRPIPRDELPDPPGFAPIPITDTPEASRGVPAAPATATTAAAATVGATAAANTPAASAAAAAATPKPSAAPSAKSPGQAGQGGGKVARQSSIMSIQDKQLMALEKRQKLFKEAALQAKQQGQMDTAREYLKQALSINKLIEVSKAGLPVDMTTLPVPPQMQVKTNMDFEIISKEDCQVTGDREEMYSKLEQDIIAQVKMCMSNRTYFKEVGDVSSANKFEQMAVHSKKDLDAVRFAFKRGDPVPKFHYETRAFSRVVSFTELTDNDLELTVIQGINYVVKNPKDVDTYVRWEFPFPRETPVVDKTAVVKDTNNPEYNAKFMLVVNPRDKTFQRAVKRTSVKLEVWSKGGFLRSDTLLGTAQVKLAPLETVCEIHDSFDLYDGRKPVGGKVEVRLRLRNPIVSKQIEQAQEKWLVVKF